MASIMLGIIVFGGGIAGAVAIAYVAIQLTKDWKVRKKRKQAIKEETERARKLAQERIDWVINYGTSEQKQTLLLWMQAQQLQELRAQNMKMQQLRALVGLDIFLNM